MGPYAVGVDLGGTNLRVARVDRAGQVFDLRAEAVDWSSPATEPFAQIVRLVRRVLDGQLEVPVGIGVAATGPVDRRTGVIDNPHTLPAAMQGDVRAALTGVFGLPVAVENDADAAAVGEAWHGAGRRSAVLACVTVGTGIGVGVVVGGEVFRGPGGVHPELGHHVVDLDGPLCYCGARGCWESLASGQAIVRAAVAQGVVPPGAGALDVVRAAAGGDWAARAVLDEARAALAVGIANVVAFHVPDVVVVTGNARGEGDALFAAVRGRLAASPFLVDQTVTLSTGELGGSAGCVGAAALVLRR